MLTIAHLSDVHLPLVPPRWHEWNVKRILGALNWLRRRHRIHRPETLALLLADLEAQRADHVVVTGDLVNLALPAEIEAAAGWLRRLGAPSAVTVVPGNHDAYVAVAPDAGIARWVDYMRGDAPGSPIGPTFPFVRRLGPVALVGLSTAVPTPVGSARGMLGEPQLAALEMLLGELSREAMLRVVLIHHPPLPGLIEDWKALIDADRLAGVLARAGAELVLHGHAHRAMMNVAAGPDMPIPVIGVPSASAARAHHDEPMARYNLLRIDPAARSIEQVERGLAVAGGPVVEIARRRL
jgi:3',5'-cyclic AMP phosphodiesterase CpdA